ncbi:hypothetical protein [uncultured Enterococcus sp.]|uniref:hypothetical protein n=1 Tax=uncultured Enterococcus sp. TaxID=167972 RepID=UPI002AA685C5|nr:hypothetical protein [uncultured Enterococcus sp.]
MNTIRQLKKKIRDNQYEIEDIEQGFTFDNENFLSFLIYEIAKKKIISEKIIQNLKSMALGENDISNKSIGGIFTLKVTACATLLKLGINDEFNLLNNDEKEVVVRILDYQDWKNI